jgi:hypothetical protein
MQVNAMLRTSTAELPKFQSRRWGASMALLVAATILVSAPLVAHARGSGGASHASAKSATATKATTTKVTAPKAAKLPSTPAVPNMTLLPNPRGKPLDMANPQKATPLPGPIAKAGRQSKSTRFRASGCETAECEVQMSAPEPVKRPYLWSL